MKKLQYSPDALEKLHEIKQDITARYGAEKAKNVIREMTKGFRDLQQFESKGSSVENLIGISCDYRMLYVQHNYAVYRIEGDVVRITDIFNEKNAGVSNITYRVNPNDYMYSLVHDFGFEEKRYVGYTTADIFPPVYNAFDSVWNILEDFLVRPGCSDREIDCIRESYEDGWDE